MPMRSLRPFGAQFASLGSAGETAAANAMDEGSIPYRDAETFEALALPLAESLYRLAFHLTRNQAEAEDLTQETFLRAFRAFDAYRGGNFRAWVFAILRNAFRDNCRRRGREPLTDDDVDDLLPFRVVANGAVAPSAESEALRTLPSEAIERAFAALPPEWRLTVILADVEELSYREIADVLDVPIGTVMSRLSRARKRLQDQLRDVPRAAASTRGRSA
jgi:RNA polymerase sigma-70 factor, ECF subfamily